MASNKKSRARSEKNKTKANNKFVNVLVAIDKVFRTGEELRPHYVGRGQSITRGKGK